MGRLGVLEHGHTPEVREELDALRAELGFVSDVRSMLMYRSDLFGQPFSEALQEVMRGDSEWTVAERELFAAFVSAQNQCPFWTESHGAVATVAFGNGELVDAVLTDWRTAPVDERLRAMLGFLAKVTRTPGDVTAADAAAARAAGVSHAAFEDALDVCAGFNLISRLADAFAFAPISQIIGREALLEYEAKFLEAGYV